MPTSRPRIQVVLDEPLIAAVKELAERDGVSVSTKIRDLLRSSLGFTDEDYYANPEAIVRKMKKPPHPLFG